VFDEEFRTAAKGPRHLMRSAITPALNGKR
jgi:hypothetical protein